MKSTVDFADLLGIYLVISKSLSGKGEIRFLAAGLGWASADCVATRLVPLWVGAKGLGFDWRYIQLSLESNLSLVHYLAVATVVWMWSRNDASKSVRNAGLLLLVYAAYRNMIFE
uniref:BOS complex subunit TMEM147 n=1 Tax=Romanomermis culicivorax TaxID=13658 RepID=A0A915IQB9_ROMCU